MKTKAIIEGKCKENVHRSGEPYSGHQCRRNAVKDGYCNIHHPDSKRKRIDKSLERAAEARKHSPYELLKNASERITKLEKRVNDLEKENDALKFEIQHSHLGPI